MGELGRIALAGALLLLSGSQVYAIPPDGPAPVQSPAADGEDQPAQTDPDAQEEQGAVEQAAGDAATTVNAPVSSAPAKQEGGDGNRYPDCEFDSVEECDLAAQQSMAESTHYMNIAAWLAAGLSLAAVLLLWRTLYHTKIAAGAAGKAVEDGRRSADAAVASVKEARVNSQREIRAYIGIADVNLHLISDECIGRLVITLHNFGSTPARKVQECCIIYSFAAGTERFGLDNVPVRDLPEMFPGQDLRLNRDISFDEWDSFVGRLTENNRTLFVYGSIAYEDAFKEPHWTKFSYWLPFEINLDGVNPLIPYDEGNDSD